MIGVVIAAALFGWLNERYGTRLTISIPSRRDSRAGTPDSDGFTIRSGLACYSAVFSLARRRIGTLCPPGSSSSNGLGHERPLYVGLTNTLNGITALPTLGGLILQWTDNNYPLVHDHCSRTLMRCLLSVSLRTCRAERKRLGMSILFRGAFHLGGKMKTAVSYLCRAPVQGARDVVSAGDFPQSRHFPDGDRQRPIVRPGLGNVSPHPEMHPYSVADGKCHMGEV